MVHIEEVTEDEALELKNRGNAAFKQQSFAEADRLFTEALQLSSEQELKSVVLANRALVRMRMDHPARALEDATEALRLDRKNNKAAFRKGCCELQLRRLDEASKTFRALESAGGMKDEVTNKLASVALRKREQEAAEYDGMRAVHRAGRGSSDPREGPRCSRDARCCCGRDLVRG